jgi:hypothetical protein
MRSMIINASSLRNLPNEAAIALGEAWQLVPDWTEIDSASAPDPNPSEASAKHDQRSAFSWRMVLTRPAAAGGAAS